jgi:glucose/arabinose dehydrogenase
MFAIPFAAGILAWLGILLASPLPRNAPAFVPASGLRATLVVQDLDAPLFVTAPDRTDAALYVVEQPGRVRVVRGGRLHPRPFLDLTHEVSDGGERGLLGLAFDPRGGGTTCYVDYTDREGNTRVVRYRVEPGFDRADSTSAEVILRVTQPYANHNGGMLAFGADGMLYVALGDGGSGGDPHGNGQSLGTLLGKILRLDVRGGAPYAIPRDNPFVGVAGARGEIWAYGLRNPWRFSFDRAAPTLYIGDVGQNRWEEIDTADARTGGLNYGWNRREGLHPFKDGPAIPSRIEPAVEYGHGEGCSVIGGYCYRGAAMPALRGTYFFSDWCSGWLRSFRWRAGQVTERRQWSVGSLGRVTSFGEDHAGELYVTTSEGKVFRLGPAAAVR